MNSRIKDFEKVRRERQQYEEMKMAELSEKNSSYKDYFYAIHLAKLSCEESGLHAGFNDDGTDDFSLEQGLKAACHGREDISAVLIIQLSLLQRLDKVTRNISILFLLRAVLIILVFLK